MLLDIGSRKACRLCDRLFYGLSHRNTPAASARALVTRVHRPFASKLILNG